MIFPRRLYRTTYDTILNLGTGEAVVSFLGADGIPTMAEKVYILPPQSNFGTISDSQRDTLIKSSICYSKYAEAVDPDSAFEFLERRGVEEAEALAKEKAEAEAAKQKEKEEKEAARKAEAEAKAAQREKEKEEAAKKRAAKTVASSITGTVGREVGKTVGGKFGKFGKTLGGNVGASLGRGLLSTLFSKK